MRHNVYGKHLGRDKNQRTALFRGLIRSLLLEGSITTTDAKVKAIKGLVDKLFTKAKKRDNASLNVLTKILPQKEVSEKLIELAKKSKDRSSGFTETLRLGQRQGDGAMMVRMSLIDQLSDLSSQSSDSGGSVISQSETEELKTEKPKSENRKQKTDNKKQKEKK